jgi:hypothetical protein
LIFVLGFKEGNDGENEVSRVQVILTEKRQFEFDGEKNGEDKGFQGSSELAEGEKKKKEDEFDREKKMKRVMGYWILLDIFFYLIHITLFLII